MIQFPRFQRIPGLTLCQWVPVRNCASEIWDAQVKLEVHLNEYMYHPHYTLRPIIRRHMTQT